jgi:Tol biopolymer transport system component
MAAVLHKSTGLILLALLLAQFRSASPNDGKIVLDLLCDSVLEVYVMDADGSNLTRITNEAARGRWAAHPAWSPDGSEIAYVAIWHQEVPHRSEIYLTDAAGQATRPLTATPEGKSTWQPSWSPDGKQIAFVSDRDGSPDIYILAKGGGSLRRVTHTAGENRHSWNPSWSPKGHEIAFNSNRSGKDEIYVIDLNEDRQRALTATAGEGKESWTPAWSPDGEMIAFASNRDGRDELYIMDAEGSNVRRLNVRAVGRPRWSPDGKKLLFQAVTAPNHEAVYVVNLDGTGLVRLTGGKCSARHPQWCCAPKHYKVAAAEAPDPRVTPDGRYRFYAEEDGAGDAHLFVRDLKTGETRRLTKGPGGVDGDAMMSPDGKQIAYSWRPSATQGILEIRIVGIDASEPRVVYSNRNTLLLGVYGWSPDGQYLAATVFQENRTSQLVLVSVADASVRVVRTQVAKTLNASGQWDQMSFSPDGRFVAFDLSPQGGWHPRDIFAMSVEGGPEIPLVQHAANDLLLDWTPDGRGVFFASDRSGHWDLWVIQVSDGQPRGSPELVKPNFGSFIDGNWFTSLGFSRDGSYYYKLWAREADLYVATFDPARNRLQGPTKLVSHVGWRTSPAWSRDGRYLAYVRGRGTAYDSFILGIRSAQTGEERRLRLDGLIRHGGHGFDPRWSPDGRFILADARERDYAGPLMDSQGLYRIDVQTGSFTPLVQTTATIAGIDSPTWSPDGRVIYERRPPLGDRSRIVARDLETGEEKELYRAVPPAHVHHWPTSNLAVSPDGQRLAFVWSDAKNVERATALMVLPSAGGEPRELLRAQDPAVIGVPAWTPDSRHILYARSVWGEKPTFELWRISADGGEAQNLGLVMEGLEPCGLSVHPDGKRIAFTAGTDREEVWVLKDFLPAVKTGKK